MIIELARVNHPNKNRMEIAKAFAKHPSFKMHRLGEVISTMRSYERVGLLVITDTEAILYHEI